MKLEIYGSGFLFTVMLVAAVTASVGDQIPQAGEWNGWNSIGTTQASGSPYIVYAAPAAACPGPGRIDVFSLDTTGYSVAGSRTAIASSDGNTWLGGGFGSAGPRLSLGTNPIAVLDGISRIDIWAGSVELRHTSFNYPNWDTSWEFPEGQHFGMLSDTGPAAIDHGGNKYVFWVRNFDQHLMAWKYTGSGPLNGWENAVDLGAPTGLTVASSPSACHDGTNYWVFVQASDSKLWACRGDTAWTWISISGGSNLRGTPNAVPEAAPSAVSRSPGTIDVYYITSADNLVQRHMVDNSPVTWTGETVIDHWTGISDPSATVWDGGRMDLFVQDTTSMVYQSIWRYQGSMLGVFRPSTRQFILNTDPITRITYGLSTDTPVTGDWNGDGKTEIGVFRAVGTQGQFILDTDNDGVAEHRVKFGLASDKPVSGDWDHDNYDEIGVYRAVGSQGQFILDYTNCDTIGTRTGVASSRINFGTSTDIPIPIDLNNDGTTEVGVFRPSTRQFIVKTNPVTRITYGVGTDKPVRSWFSHDGTSRIGVFRAGQFIINNDPITRFNFGLSTDKPITGIWV